MGQTQTGVAKNISSCNCSSVEHLKCVQPKIHHFRNEKETVTS